MRRQTVTQVAVVVVAVVAAIVSYAHMQKLASGAGENWRSWLIPLSVDGLIVAASMVLLTARRHLFAWSALAVAVLTSLAANMAAARPGLIPILVAGWAPVAFAASFHLLLTHRRLLVDQEIPGEAVSPELETASPPALYLRQPPAPADLVRPPAPADLADLVGPLVAEGLGRQAIASRLGISQHQARLAITEARQLRRVSA